MYLLFTVLQLTMKKNGQLFTDIYKITAKGVV